MPARAWRPTLPVLHCTTRYDMGCSLVPGGLEVGDWHLEVRRLQPAIHLENLAGDVGPGGRAQVEDGGGDVLDLTEPLEWRGVLHGGTELVAGHDDVERGRCGGPDPDRVHPDARSQVARGQARVLLHRALDG